MQRRTHFSLDAKRKDERRTKEVALTLSGGVSGGGLHCHSRNTTTLSSILHSLRGARGGVTVMF